MFTRLFAINLLGLKEGPKIHFTSYLGTKI